MGHNFSCWPGLAQASFTGLEEGGSWEQREKRHAIVCSRESASNSVYREGQRGFLQMDRETSTLIQSLYGDDSCPGPGSGAVILSDFPNRTLIDRRRLKRRVTCQGHRHTSSVCASFGPRSPDTGSGCPYLEGNCEWVAPGAERTFADTSVYVTEWEGQSHLLLSVCLGKTLPLAKLFSSL